MLLREWILYVAGTGVSVVSAVFAFLQYFNVSRQRKLIVLRNTLLISGGGLLVVFLFGFFKFVELSPPKTSDSGDLNLPAHPEVTLEYPVPEQFPTGNAPLVRPVTELFIWKNRGGPINHREAHMVDEIDAVAGRCGQPDDLKRRTIPLLGNPSHLAVPITRNMTETPFFFSPKADYFGIMDHAVYGIEFDANGDTIKPYSDAFERYLRQQGLCGYISRRSILVKFDFEDVHAHTASLYYRFMKVVPFETMSASVWTEMMSQIPDSERQLGYNLKDLGEPCRLLRYVQRGKLLGPCNSVSP